MRRTVSLAQNGLTLSILLALLSSFYGSALEFTQGSYDWDLDTELYFGGELLGGRLIWTREFHDKLPVLQMLFALVASTGGITFWRIFSILSILCVVVVALKNFPVVLSPMRRRDTRHVAVLSGALFLLLLTQAPGGLTHINASAASFAMASTILAYRLSSHDWSNVRPHLAIVGLSVFSALAISIRPYFAVPIGLTLIFLLLKSVKSNPNKSFVIEKPVFVAFLAPPLVTLALNILPYFLTSQLSAFDNGIRFLGRPSVPQSAWEGFLQTLPSVPSEWTLLSLSQFFMSGWLGFLLLSSIYLMTFWLFSRKSNLFITFVLPLGIMSLFLSIMSQHWWPHYSVLFAWYAAVIVAYSLVRVWAVSSTRDLCNTSRFRVQAIVSVLLIPIILAVGAITAVFVNSKKLVLDKGFEMRSSQMAFFEEYLDSQFKIRPSFLAPNDMYLHFVLREPRHGFPHAANSRHVASGWWVSVPTSNTFIAPRSTSDYCHELSRANFDLLILEDSSPLMGCGFDSASSPLVIHSKTIEPSGKLLHFFIRKEFHR